MRIVAAPLPIPTIFLEEYKPIPLSQKRPVQLLTLVGPSFKAGLPAVFLSFLIASATYFTFGHTQVPGADAALLDAFGASGIEAGFEHQGDLLTGMRAGQEAQHYVGFDTEFDISGGRLIENSTSNKVVMEVESNLPSYWQGKAFDLYTGRGWAQSPEVKSASWTLEPPAGTQTLYHGLIHDATLEAAGIVPDPDVAKDQVKQTFYLITNLPGIVFTAYQPVELSVPVAAVKIDDTFTLNAPIASDSMVAGQEYQVVSEKHFAQAPVLQRHDYKARGP